MSYAGFWKRFAAAFIDGIIQMIGGCAIGFVYGIVMAAGSRYDTAELKAMGFILGLILGWIYFAVMESSPTQGTLGKMALRIKVTDLKGSKIDFGKATGRHFGKIISYLILLIGFIMVAFTQKKQGLHDMMAGCLVVNRDFDIAHAPVAHAEDAAAIEKICREADARAIEEKAQRKTSYPVRQKTQQDEEFIILLKSAINENRLDAIPDEDLLEIYSSARSIADFRNTLGMSKDTELSKAINTLLGEIKKRGLS